MNYEKIYNDLMSDRLDKKLLRIKEKKSGTYFEGHHIIPKCKGGTGSSNRPKNNPNIVLLTAREHFLAHWLLWRMYRDRQMALAFHKMMSINNNTHRITNSRAYSEAREAFSITNKGNTYGVGVSKTLSDSHKKKISEFMTGRFVGDLNPSKRPEVREKISKANTGKVRSESTIEKMRIVSKNISKIQCIHCNKEIDVRNAKKWHFENCLKNPNGHNRITANFKPGNTYGCKSVMEVSSGLKFESIQHASEYYNVPRRIISKWIQNDILCTT